MLLVLLGLFPVEPSEPGPDTPSHTLSRRVIGWRLELPVLDTIPVVLQAGPSVSIPEAEVPPRYNVGRRNFRKLVCGGSSRLAAAGLNSARARGLLNFRRQGGTGVRSGGRARRWGGVGAGLKWAQGEARGTGKAAKPAQRPNRYSRGAGAAAKPVQPRSRCSGQTGAAAKPVQPRSRPAGERLTRAAATRSAPPRARARSRARASAIRWGAVWPASADRHGQLCHQVR